MLATEIIEFSDSDCATVPVFAEKKDLPDGTSGGVRMALDYRHLNAQLWADSQGVPNLLDTLESLAKAKRASIFDGASGFWAVPLRKQDRKYAAFHAWVQGAWHLVQPMRMMFGFKGATACYVRMMNKLYGPSRRGAGKCVCKSETCKGGIECKAGVSDDNLVGKTAEVFVDDTVVKSVEVEDHVNDLATVLISLIANGITLKMEKGIWGTDELPLLGHVVHNYG